MDTSLPENFGYDRFPLSCAHWPVWKYNQKDNGMITA